MAALDTILAGAKTALTTITGLRTANTWPDQITVPMAWPVVADADYEETGGVDCRLGLQVFVVVAQGGGLARAQRELNDYVSNTGTKSLPKTLRDDGDLDGAVSSILSIRLTSYGILSIADQDYIGAVFRVEVWAE